MSVSAGRNGPFKQMKSGLLLTELLAFTELPRELNLHLEPGSCFEHGMCNLCASRQRRFRTALRRSMYTHGSRIWFHVASRTVSNIWLYASSFFSCRLVMIIVTCEEIKQNAKHHVDSIDRGENVLRSGLLMLTIM